VIAVRFHVVGGTGLQIDAEERKEKGQGISDVMPSVRKQGETVGVESGDKFDEDESYCRNGREHQDLTGAVVMVVIVHSDYF